MDVIEAKDLPYSRFLADYLIPNRPVLIRGIADSWPAFDLWTEASEDAEGSRKPRWDELDRLYGDSEVPVVIEGTGKGKDEPRRTKKPFRTVLERWRRLEQEPQSTEERKEEERWYVKDWHLAKLASQPFYSTPELFQDDWLNSYYTATSDDDFRFVYMGERGTVTRIHRDVYASNSWSTNVLGVKRWTLFPPEVTHCLRRNASTSPAAELVDDVEDLASGEVNEETFPLWKRAWEARIEVTQSVDETIFVPGGWYHQVTNVSPFVLSINHNWSNSTTFPSLYRAHCVAVEDAEEALSDVKELLQERKGDNWEEEWVDCVSGVVKADSGWDWKMLWSCASHGVSAYRMQPSMDSAFPLAPSHLRPEACFVARQLAPYLSDFRQRREYLISPAGDDLRRTFDDLQRWTTAALAQGDM